MKIKQRYLTGLVGIFPGGVSVADGTKSVHRFYCGPMTAKSLCTENCLDCEARLRRAFTFNGTPNSPVGLLIWRLRDAVAVAAEEASEASKVEHVKKLDAFGLPITEANPFTEFMNEIKT